MTDSTHGKARNCQVVLNQYWPLSGSLNLDDPAECPFHIGGPMNVNYGATGSLPSGSVTPNQFMYTVTDMNINTVTADLETAWYTDDNPWTIVITGTYSAGDGGFDANNNGYDTIYNELMVGGSFSAIATVTLAYSYGFPGTTVSAPDATGENVPFTAHASINDPATLPPVTYQWLVNGNPVSASGPDLNWQGSSDGSTITIGVVTTDANNVSHSATHDVAGCPNNQITC